MGDRPVGLVRTTFAPTQEVGEQVSHQRRHLPSDQKWQGWSVSEEPSAAGGREQPFSHRIEGVNEETLKERKRRAENIHLVFKRGNVLVGEHLLPDDDMRQDLVRKWKKVRQVQAERDLDQLLHDAEAAIENDGISLLDSAPTCPADQPHREEEQELGDHCPRPYGFSASRKYPQCTADVG